MFFRFVTTETKEPFFFTNQGDVSVTHTIGTTKIAQSNQMSTSVTRET